MKYMRFRKKPVEVEAWKFTGKWDKEMKSIAEKYQALHPIKDRNKVAFIVIDTLEGEMRAMPGDWIIMGVDGELYPCKPDIFEKTYDKIN